MLTGVFTLVLAVSSLATVPELDGVGVTDTVTVAVSHTGGLALSHT